MTLSVLFSCSILSGCRQSNHPKISEPVLTINSPEFDEETSSFNLSVSADSVDGGNVTFFLMIGDSIIDKNNDGKFRNIQPFDEGYDVKMEVLWPDTIIERINHVMDFVRPPEPVSKILPEDLAKMINNLDESLRSGTNKNVAQGVKVNVIDSEMKVQMLPDALILIENGIWNEVEITHLEYNDMNLVSVIELRPIGEKKDVIDTDDEDYDY